MSLEGSRAPQGQPALAQAPPRASGSSGRVRTCWRLGVHLPVSSPRSPRWHGGPPWVLGTTSQLARHRSLWAASPSCSIPSTCQHHQQQWQCSKVPPPSWSCVPCPSATKLPVFSLALSAKCGPQEGATRRLTLCSTIPLLPRSPNEAGAELTPQPGDTLTGAQRGGCPKPTAPALPRQVSCRWTVNHLPVGELHLSSDQLPGMTFKGKASLHQRI